MDTPEAGPAGQEPALPQPATSLLPSHPSDTQLLGVLAQKSQTTQPLKGSEWTASTVSQRPLSSSENTGYRPQASSRRVHAGKPKVGMNPPPPPAPGPQIPGPDFAQPWRSSWPSDGSAVLPEGERPWPESSEEQRCWGPRGGQGRPDTEPGPHSKHAEQACSPAVCTRAPV